MFLKDHEHFPVKKEFIYLSNCGVAPLHQGARDAARAFMEERSLRGAGVFQKYGDVLERLRTGAARFLRTAPENISFMKNTSEGLNLIANGYPFREGDEIISYVHEYPSNHYPWLLQRRRGIILKLLPDCDPVGNLPGGSPDTASGDPTDPVSGIRPRGWSFADLEKAVTPRTRVIAISHVQFTSGYAADLQRLGDFCQERGIDLVVDGAQSLGALPLYPEDFGIQAIACSGWKWLLGPLGCGLLYTAPEFRSRIEVTMGGASVVVQGDDYLNHNWEVHRDGRRFEYSTIEAAFAAGLARSFEEFLGPHDAGEIRTEILRLQNVFLERVDRDLHRPLLFPEPHRSGILALLTTGDPRRVAEQLRARGIFCTERSGYLRIAPHIYNDDDEMRRAAEILNGLN